MIFWTLASSSKSYCRFLINKNWMMHIQKQCFDFFLDSDFHAVVSCYCNGLGYCFPKSKLKSSHFPKSIRQKFRGQGMRMTDQTRVFRILFMTFMYTFQRERQAAQCQLSFSSFNKNFFFLGKVITQFFCKENILKLDFNFQ